MYDNPDLSSWWGSTKAPRCEKWEYRCLEPYSHVLYTGNILDVEERACNIKGWKEGLVIDENGITPLKHAQNILEDLKQQRKSLEEEHEYEINLFKIKRSECQEETDEWTEANNTLDLNMTEWATILDDADEAIKCAEGFVRMLENLAEPYLIAKRLAATTAAIAAETAIMASICAENAALDAEKKATEVLNRASTLLQQHIAREAESAVTAMAAESAVTATAAESVSTVEE